MASYLKQQAVSGMIWSSLQRFGTMGVSFLANMVLARLLSPDDFGYIGMLTIFIALSGTFVDGGFGNALIQKKQPTETDYSTVFYWNIFFSVIIYLLLYIASPYIAMFYHMDLLSDILRLEGLILIINSFTIIQANKLRKQFNFKKLAIITLSASIISFIVAIVMAYNGYGVWSLVVQQLVISGFSAILFWTLTKWRPSLVFSVQSFKELFGFGAFMMGSTLLNTFCNNLNGLLIGRFFNAATMGYFAQAQKMESVSSTSLISVVEQVTYPILSSVQNDRNRMCDILKQLNVVILFVLMPLMLLIILLSKPIIVFFFSSKWLPSVPFLQILALQGIAACLQGVNYNAVAAIGKSQSIFKWTLVKRISGVILLVIGLNWGIYGILWSMVLNSYLICIINSALVDKFINYSLLQQFRDLLPTLIVGLITFISIYLFQQYLFFNIYISAVIVLISFVIIYLLLSKIFSVNAFTILVKIVKNVKK